jgi:hypothetical protein
MWRLYIEDLRIGVSPKKVGEQESDKREWFHGSDSICRLRNEKTD